MARLFRILFVGIFILMTVDSHSALDPAEPKPTFKTWLEKVKKKARAKGISFTTLKKAFHKIHAPLDRIIALDQNQPELKKSFDAYYDKSIPPLIPKGKKHLKKHKKILDRIEKKYGIPKAIIVALWGRETNYGSFVGKTPTIHTLATLAYDGRREELFTNELFHALHILEEKHIHPDSLKGSWAGAIGQCQFMPSSFRNHAVDETGKGKKDIWNTLEDVFGSTANFLKKEGWNSKEPCLYEVVIPKDYKGPRDDIKIKKTLHEWKQIGIKRLHNKAYPKEDLGASLLCPEKSQRCFLVFENIHAILKWNRSLNFALSIGLLAHNINGGEIDNVA
ncbi:MAG: lytic murein transglycosylase [Alphaproteobacteria bacterium]|nr:lytic murein transglycosylase [Alphaproteobacteria bacterium]